MIWSFWCLFVADILMYFIFFSWPDQKLHVLPVKTNRSLHHTTLHVSRGHVNACSLWSLQPSPRPKNLTTFLLFRRGIYWTKKHFPSWFLQSRSLDDGRVSALGPALCPLKHMLKGSNTRSRTPTNPTNSLCLFFLFYFFFYRYCKLFIIKFKTMLNFLYQHYFLSYLC